MKKLESSLLNMVLVLTSVAVIMGGILAFVNHLTEGPINDQKAKALADGIKTVLACDDLTVTATDRLCSGENGIGSVVFIERGEDYYFISRVCHRHHGSHHCFGAAAGNDYLAVRVYRSAHKS